jgi:hypothetical protein
MTPKGLALGVASCAVWRGFRTQFFDLQQQDSIPNAPVATSPKIARVGHIDMRPQAIICCALRSATPE